MRCLKCGRDIADEQVFCEDCQTDMAQYPVKPGTPIQLPHRAPEPPVKKKPGKEKPELKPEERIARLRRRVRWLTLALAAGGAVSSGMHMYIYDMFHESAIFEEEYVDPDSVEIEFPEEKRNLIYIFLESMETTYFSETLGDDEEEGLIYDGD